MSNYHFKEKEMSLKAKGLLSLMLSLPDSWNYSVSGLVKLSKDGKDSVMSALAELEAFGYLTRVRLTNSKGQFNGVEYNIYELPQTEKPIAAKQNMEKQHAAKQYAENQPQLNTNQLNTEKIKDIKELNTNEVLAGIEDVELKKLYESYLEMRESNKDALTPKGLEMLKERCERLSRNSVKVQKLLLETAIINNWKNVYLPKDEELAVANLDNVNNLKQFYNID
jgi:hypothetical protein